MRVFAAVLAVLVASSIVVTTDPGPTAAATDGISARIVLPSTRVRSGAQLHGFVEIRNDTGGEITAIGCLSLFQVALVNRSARPVLLWSQCREEFTIPTGRSRDAVTVRADHGGCSGDPLPAGTSGVRCGPDGEIPGLAPGVYRAKLYQNDRVVADPSPVRVRVLEASGKPTPYGASDRRSYPLPSSGWTPGAPTRLARISGAFHAALTADGACAWLGDGSADYLWPAGYRVRFHPTELLDRDGHVVARGGDLVDFGGGWSAASERSRCGRAGQETAFVQSDRLSIVER